MLEKDNPLISVLMPVYNGEKFLKEAIQGISNQTYKNFEFIIVDDNSQDKSWVILEDFAKNDKRIKIFKNKENLGIAKNRNRALSLAKGEYYAIMDQDDMSQRNRLEEELNFLETHSDYAVVGSQTYLINNFSEIIGKRKYPETDSRIKSTLPMKSPFCNSSTMIRSSAFEKDFFYDERFSGSEDYDFWFRICAKGYKMANLSSFLHSYRISRNEYKIKSCKKILKDTIKIQKKWFSRKKLFNLKGLAYLFLENLLLLFPNIFIVKIFEIISYEKS